MLLGEDAEQFLHRQSRVDDVLDDDHRASLDVLVQADQLLDMPRGLGAHIGGHAHKTDFAGGVDAADEVCGKHERAVEHRQQERLLPLQVAANLCGHFGYALLYLLFGEEYLEVLVFYLYVIHGACVLSFCLQRYFKASEVQRKCNNYF